MRTLRLLVFAPPQQWTAGHAPGLPDGGDDVRIGAATAQVAAHPLADLLIGELRGVCQVLGAWARMAGLTSASTPTAEQIWPGVQ